MAADLRREFARDRQRLALRHDAADEAERERFLGRVHVGREEHLHRLREGDLAAEPDDAAALRVQRPLRLGEAEDAALAGDADVGALQDLGAAGDAVALDGGDQRLLQRPVAEEAVEDDGVVLADALLELVLRRQPRQRSRRRACRDRRRSRSRRRCR